MLMDRLHPGMLPLLSLLSQWRTENLAFGGGGGLNFNNTQGILYFLKGTDHIYFFFNLTI